jgi:maleate cis-trans isomerase
MAQAERTRIAFVGPRSASSAHYQSFKQIIPADVTMEFYGLELAGQSLYDLEGKKDTIIRKAAELSEKHRWQAAIFSGAPVEVLNPGFYDALRERFHFPITTALSACIAALRAYGARKLLLMTPFDEPLNRLIREHLQRAQIQAVSPAASLSHYTDALRMGQEEVYRLAENALREAGDVEGIYFQGAVLDPIESIEKMEKAFRRLVIASNPAMLWAMLSQLGLTYHIQGHGRLLAEWPKLPAS